jgi:uncharacterized membrane protein YraQ (UPF0718 family)
VGVAYAVILLAALIIGLIAYKSLSGFSKLQQVRASGTLELRDDLFRTTHRSGNFDFLVRSAKYLAIVWPALVFGILIAAGVHAFVSPAWFVRGLGAGAIREQVTAAVGGIPLMLCSCCASPVFSAVYEKSRRLSPSLALMLASPGLNPASLALCFMLFQTRIAAARVLMTLAAMLFASRLPDLLLQRASQPTHSATNAPTVEPKTFALREALCVYLRSCRYIAIQTIPLIVLGIFVAMLVPNRLTAQTFASVGGNAAIVGLVAFFAVLVALPSFFEIPLAFSILAAGAPVGAAAAVLFAGPIINFPSLLVVGRRAGWTTAVLLAFSIWVIAFGGGLVLR